MRAFGLGPQDVRVRLSDRRVLNALLQDLKVPAAQLPLAYQALDKLGRRDYADLRRQVIADGMDAGVLDQLESLKNVRTWEQFLQAKGSHAGAIAAGNQLGQTIAALHSMGLEEFLDFDLTIVRGIAYYTGTVFELFDAKRELRAICGGGRYDNLLSSLGGVDLPAVGFGMGDVVLGELLKDRGLAPPLPAPIDVLVAGITEQDLPHVLRLAHELRDGGIRVEFVLSLQPIGKQLKLADARDARFAVLIGPDDRAKGEVVIKDLRTKEQVSIAAASVVNELKRRLNA
jgi:histidyl-tRNA synthetase